MGFVDHCSASGRRRASFEVPFPVSEDGVGEILPRTLVLHRGKKKFNSALLSPSKEPLLTDTFSYFQIEARQWQIEECFELSGGVPDPCTTVAARRIP